MGSVVFHAFMPGWVINIALIVHSDQALLAAGFIFTVHFFNTHFRLEKFPMDNVIFSVIGLVLLGLIIYAMITRLTH